MNGQHNPQNTNDPDLPLSILALVSFIAGAFGFLGLPVIASIVAIWAGRAAHKATRSIPPTASGDGMAGAGILMGWIQLGMVLVALCVGMVYYIFFFESN